MIARPMTELEVWDHFKDPAQRGILAEENGNTYGWIGWNQTGPTGLYAHSLFCDPDRPEAFACIVQAMRQIRRRLNAPAIQFVVDADNPTLLTLTKHNRAKVVSHILEIK